MKTIAASLASTLALGAAYAGLSAPAQAQSRNMMEVIVYGDDPCPRTTEAEVVVCVRRGEEERYRLPEGYRSAGPRQSRQSWANQARSLEVVADTGVFSCSAVGPGGYTGCLEQLIRQSTGERREQIEGDNPPM